MFRKKGLVRSEPVKVITKGAHPIGIDKNIVRGHALFVRFLERRGLSDCVHYFPEEMTLGMLRKATPRELVGTYKITYAKDRERVLRLIEESRRDDLSESEVSLKIY